MQRSASSILTTHAGSLPRSNEIRDIVASRDPGRNAAADAARIRQAVFEVVRKQTDIGIDVVDDGEYSKPSFITYVRDRLGGMRRHHRAGAILIPGLAAGHVFGVSTRMPHA